MNYLKKFGSVCIILLLIQCNKSKLQQEKEVHNQRYFAVYANPKTIITFPEKIFVVFLTVKNKGDKVINIATEIDLPEGLTANEKNSSKNESDKNENKNFIWEIDNLQPNQKISYSFSVKVDSGVHKKNDKIKFWTTSSEDEVGIETSVPVKIK